MRLPLITLAVLLTSLAFADTPPPGAVKIKGGTDNTIIGNVADSEKVNVTNSISATVSGPVSVTQGTSPWVTSVSNFPSTFGVTQSTSPWVISGNTGRTWTLSNGTDSIAAFQGTSPWVTSRNWNLTFAGDKADVSGSSVSVSNFPATQAVTQSGTWTVQQGTPPWSVSQSGAWTTGRTWTLSSGTDSIAAVQSGAWSVTANAGTNLNTSLLQLDTTGAKLNNAQGSTTSGQTGPLVQGAVTTAAPSYTTAQTSPLSLNTSGGLRVDGSGVTQPISGSVSVSNFPATQAVTQSTSPWVVSGTVTANQGTSPWVTNVSQFGGSSVVTGTGASGAGIPRVTVSNDSNVLATQSGTWNINNVSGTVSLPTGASTAANQTTLGSQTTKINDGTNTMAVKAASTAPVATDPASVVALSPNGNQAKDTSVTGLQVTQGSTTSGQSGTLIQGAVTTNDPAYTNAQTSPITVNTRGGLRTVITGMDNANTVIRNDYSTTNVTTAAYVQLVASTSNEIHRFHIFDSSGQDFVLATGGAGSEVDQIQIPPGGWDSPVDLFVASGTRLSIKSKSATASSGILLITVLK